MGKSPSRTLTDAHDITIILHRILHENFGHMYVLITFFKKVMGIRRKCGRIIAVTQQVTFYYLWPANATRVAVVGG